MKTISAPVPADPMKRQNKAERLRTGLKAGEVNAISSQFSSPQGAYWANYYYGGR